jgi:hypothetical protein
MSPGSAVGSEQRRWRLALLGIFLIAVLIRIPPFSAVSMWFDEAVEGLMSQDVLRGRFPIFFYGQPVHGAADRYAAALVLLVLGPTPVALKVAMLLLFFVLLGSVAYTTRRIFGREVALMAALLVAVPPFYFYGWNFDSRGHYPLMLILGTWLLFLTWRILRDGVDRAPGRRFVGLGLMAGVAAWTNYLSLTFLGPIALALGIAGLRSGRLADVLRRGLIAAGFFVVGIVPLLGYYLGHQLSFLLPGRATDGQGVSRHLAALGSEALPQILGVHPRIWDDAYEGVYLVVLGATAAAALYAVAWWAGRRRIGADPGIVGLLLGVVALTLALSILTRFGTILRYPRYLLPLYLALPVFLGLALERLGRLSGLLKWIALAALVANNLLGSLALTPVLAPASAVASDRRWQAVAAEQLAFLEHHGLRHLYGGPNYWPFLSDRRVIASDPYQERMAEFVREVDAADRVGWIFRGRSEAFEASARAAGIGYRMIPGPNFVAYTDFEAAPTGYADLDPAGWSATASHEPEDAVLAVDRRLESVWRTRVSQAPGQFYQLDLGRVQTVGLVTWLPRWTHEMPAGFAVAVSTDAQAWREVARVPEYLGPLYWSGTHPFRRIRRGRVEARFPATEARHVRIELVAAAGSSWSMREVLVAAPVGTCAPVDPAALVGTLLRAGVRFAYADHWASANIARLSHGAIRVLPSNKSVNSYRLEQPPPDEIEPVRLRPGRAIVVEACPPEVAAAVARVLGDRGVRHTRQAVGGFVVFASLDLPSIAGSPVPWRTLGNEGELTVELPAPRFAEYLVLECGDDGGARRGLLEATLLPWAPEGRGEPVPHRVVTRGTLRMSGSRLFLDAPWEVALTFERRRVAGARVLLGAAGSLMCPVRGVRLGP